MRKSPLPNGAASSTLQQVTFLLLLLVGTLFIQATWGNSRLDALSSGENSDQLSAAASAILAYEPTETTVTGSTNTTVQTTSVGGLSASGGVNGTALGGSGTVNAGTGVSGSFGSGGTLNASGNANTGGSSGSSLLGNDTGSGAGSWSAFQSWATGGTSDGSGSSNNNNTNKNTSVWSNVWSTTNSGGSAIRNGTSLTGGSIGQVQQDPNYFSVTAKNIFGALFAGTGISGNATLNRPTFASGFSYLFSPTSLTNTAPSTWGTPTGFLAGQSTLLTPPSNAQLVGGNVLSSGLPTLVKTQPYTGFFSTIPVAGSSGSGNLNPSGVSTRLANQNTLNNANTFSTYATEYGSLFAGPTKGGDVANLVTAQAAFENPNFNATCSGNFSAACGVGQYTPETWNSQFNDLLQATNNLALHGTPSEQQAAHALLTHIGTLQGDGANMRTDPQTVAAVMSYHKSDLYDEFTTVSKNTGVSINAVAQMEHFGPGYYAALRDNPTSANTVTSNQSFIQANNVQCNGICTPLAVAQDIQYRYDNPGARNDNGIGIADVLLGTIDRLGKTGMSLLTSNPITVIQQPSTGVIPSTGDGATVQTASYSPNQPLNQQVVGIGMQSFGNIVGGILSGQSPNTVIFNGVTGAVGQIIPLVVSTAVGNPTTQVPSSNDQGAFGKIVETLLSYAPGMGGQQNDIQNGLGAIAGSFGISLPFTNSKQAVAPVNSQTQTKAANNITTPSSANAPYDTLYSSTPINKANMPLSGGSGTGANSDLYYSSDITTSNAVLTGGNVADNPTKVATQIVSKTSNGVGPGPSLTELQNMVGNSSDGSSGGIFGVVGKLVNTGFSMIKTAYSGSGVSSKADDVGSGPGNFSDLQTTVSDSSNLSGKFTVPIDPTQTGSFVKADPVTGKPVATPTTPSGVYYDRGLAVALELNTKERALQNAGVVYTVKDGEIIISVPASGGLSDEQNKALQIAKENGVDTTNPTNKAVILSMYDGMAKAGSSDPKLDTPQERYAQIATTINGINKGVGTINSMDIFKKKPDVTLSGVFQAIADPSQATGDYKLFEDGILKALNDGKKPGDKDYQTPQTIADAVAVAGKEADTPAQKGGDISFSSLSVAEQAKKLKISDAEYQKIQKISDTAFGAETAGTKTTATANLTLVKVVNTTEEDAKCRSSIVCSIAVAPFGGVEGAKQTYAKILAQQAPASTAIFPVSGLTQVTDNPNLNDTFGSSRGSTRLHAGDDIYAPVGTPVLAVMDGIIRRADNDNPTGYGLRVDIEYPDGTVHRMAHLSQFEIQPCEPGQCHQTVKAGQVLALSGRSGIEDPAIGSHVHYEVIKTDEYNAGKALSVYDEKTLEAGRLDPAAYFEKRSAEAIAAAAEKPTTSGSISYAALKAGYDLLLKTFPKPQEIVVDSGTAQKFLNPGQPTETPTGNGGGTGTGNGGVTNRPGQNAGDLINPWANGGSGGNNNGNNGGGRGTTSTTTVATSTNNFIGNFLGGLFGGIGGGRSGTGNGTGQSGDIGSSITGLVGNIFGTILGGVTGSPSGGVNGIGGILQGFGNIFGNVFGQALSGNNAGGTGQNGAGTGNQNQNVTPLVAQRPDIVCNPNSVRANQPTAVTVSWVCYGSTSADGIGFPIRAGAPAANIVINVGATTTTWLSYGIRCSNGTTRSCVIPVN